LAHRHYRHEYTWNTKYICLHIIICPYKFAYKNTLFGLYRMAGDTANAKRMANLILKMPVKKESPVID
jgi:hypothetical protein